LNPRVILGIETSCDETAAALLINGRIVADRTTRQLLHERYGGVVPELASRAHERLLTDAVEGVMRDASVKTDDIEAVAATYGPGLAGALLVGLSFAKGLAAGLGVPFLGVNHIEGHLWSAELTAGPLPLPFLGLVASGGHTLTVGVHGFGRYNRLGATRDDAAGELFDKVGRLLGYGFPAGEAIDKEAMDYNGDPVRFPRARLSDDPLGFSFSGLKTAVLYYLRSRYKSGKSGFELTTEVRASVAAGIMEAVADMLATGLSNACDLADYRALVVSGGVAASRFLRERFSGFAAERGLPLFIPPPEHCTDNGSMIAYAGYRRFNGGWESPLDLSVDPGADLCSNHC